MNFLTDVTLQQVITDWQHPSNHSEYLSNYKHTPAISANQNTRDEG